jgi:hypothetical protein
MFIFHFNAVFTMKFQKMALVADVCAPLSSFPLLNYQLVEWSKVLFDMAKSEGAWVRILPGTRTSTQG